MKNKTSNQKHIVVVGGGFAGLNFIQRISASPDYRITLVDQNNYNYFTPLLYQVATGFLEPSNISYPFRKLLRKKSVAFYHAALESIEPAAKTVLLSDGGKLRYDYLVLAAGSEINFFHNQNIMENSLSLKGIDDAITMRNHLIGALEKASHETNRLERWKLLTIVLAGGGPTGVELAGMFAEMKRHILPREYPELDAREVEIHVVDGAPYLLAPMSDRSHEDALAVLSRQDVHVHLNTMVTDYQYDRVYLSDGQTIDSKMLIWSAGVRAKQFSGIAEESYDKSGRLMTDAFGHVRGYNRIYAIGDISAQSTDERYPNGHPQLAQPAIQQGKNLAYNFRAMARGRERRPFRYFDRGDMAIIGRTFAVADLLNQKVHFGGFLGLLSWLFIHLISLVSYTNKLKTLYNWAIAYITCDQSLRMIFGAKPKARKTEEKENARAHVDAEI